MTHRSRLGGFIIDCRTDDIAAAATFWGAALGLTEKPAAEPGSDGYIRFARGPNDLNVEVQKVTHPSRVHLDIETDDVEAEVARLEALGAKRVQKCHTWWVLESPTGQRFCVVPVIRSDFAEEANVWP